MSEPTEEQMKKAREVVNKYCNNKLTELPWSLPTTEELRRLVDEKVKLPK